VTHLNLIGEGRMLTQFLKAHAVEVHVRDLGRLI